MYLQGNLELLFNALDSMSCIDEVLQMDWQLFLNKAKRHRKECDKAVDIVNSCDSDPTKLKVALEAFPSLILKYLAIEVGLEMLECEQYKNKQVVVH
ncbi:MAG: hypothetical protein HAW63_05540 [Bdellovibrionaceae bacterium]|nr:hypothetical protein [Pseudobdellovibrionaceae bacterium]